ncbi:MAG: O-antigen ligase family protein [Lachnospiraceae bacterium]|nr:O-antigen ligase family protein [Lachnospiraceae bacterium]
MKCGIVGAEADPNEIKRNIICNMPVQSRRDKVTADLEDVSVHPVMGSLFRRWSDYRAGGTGDTIFAAAYFVTGALSFNSLTAGSAFVKILAGLIMLWGAAVLIRRIFVIKHVRQDRLFRLSVLFYASAVISSLINMRYGIEGSLKMLIWMAFELFILSVNVNANEKGHDKRHDNRHGKRHRGSSDETADMLYGGEASIGPSVDPSTEPPVDLLTEQPVDPSTEPPVDLLTEPSVDLLSEQPVDPFIKDIGVNKDIHRTDGRGHVTRKVMFSIVFIVTFCQSLISVVMLAVGYSGAAIARGQYIGLQLGRLWGCYSDPNYGSVLACCSIAISIGFWSRRGRLSSRRELSSRDELSSQKELSRRDELSNQKELLRREELSSRKGLSSRDKLSSREGLTSRKELSRSRAGVDGVGNTHRDYVFVVLALNVVLQYIYIVFSYSRTGQICLAVELLLFTYLAASDSLRVGSGGLGKRVYWVTVFVAVVILTGPAMGWFRTGYNMVRASHPYHVFEERVTDISQSEEQGFGTSPSEGQAIRTSPSEGVIGLSSSEGQALGTSTPEGMYGLLPSEGQALGTSPPEVNSCEALGDVNTPSLPDGIGISGAEISGVGISGAPSIFREDIEEGGLTNGRIEIWKEGFLIWKDNPVFGISYRNIAEYARTNYPEGYMTTRENELNTFHNVFVDVLVSQGLVGEIIVLAMAAVILARVASLLGHGDSSNLPSQSEGSEAGHNAAAKIDYKATRKIAHKAVIKAGHKNDSEANHNAASKTDHKPVFQEDLQYRRERKCLLWSYVPAVLVIVIGLSSLTLTEIFYINTPTAVLFWYCLSLIPAIRREQKVG